MFKIDDCVMYGMTGACKVIDITNEKFINGEDRRYYVLSPVYAENIIIKAPVDNKNIPMRKTISKSSATSLLNDMANMDVSWIDDDKTRNKEFNAMLKSGKCEELIKLIRNIYCNNEKVKSIGKKPHQVDDNVMKEAERLLNEELAIALNISPDEVIPYITNHIPQQNI
ncbi:carD-like/TRCF domain protein [[Clostridium] bifermentans ATCC 638]|uniref:CarD-like/TRCF domain protein n=1 Tax=Paraclostridium bifermentans ATCC 638 = DSM 14991 TaxID=1233171 RepID=T4VJF7_PARBF|nr:CarD family transcriptional regulator [Paraclostridium bifermentans]EQK41245.1 carD-like/TRCF domain protein [[Clostridium] bifermentans ATCC 638] [Paraclostridium bifermentans ATCC 638 = DSM 14991]RIZ58938.1 CarD family transcriptional regulator [Paraclostridium bifermentans]UAG18541.1 CarD family transcriptional regulator [Paraclostridium bifermentans]